VKILPVFIIGARFHILCRIWDLGQHRCVYSYVVHTGSVWALATTHLFGHVYNGVRDQFVSLIFCCIIE
jgi:hypothetical protein